MRWFGTDEWFWETRLSVRELSERLAGCSTSPNLWSGMADKQFVGSTSQTGFQLTPVIRGISSLLPLFVGRLQTCESGTRVNIAVVPNRALQICLAVLFAFLSTLMFERHTEHVLLITVAGAAFGWICLQVCDQIGVGIAERRLRKLMEAEPGPKFELPSLPLDRRTLIVRVAAITVMGAGVSLLGLIYCGLFAFTTRPSVDLIYVYFSTQAIGVVWLFWLSKIRPTSQTHCLALLFGLQIGSAWCLMADGFRGDGRPILVWRWSSTLASELPPVPPAMPAKSIQPDFSKSSPHDFAEFRGPRRDGVVTGVRLNPDWLTFPPQIVWQQPVGAGWSAFAIAAGFAVTQEQRGQDEVVICYELATGHARWEHRDRALFHERMGGDGPRATPVISEGKVYTIGATGILNCLDGRTGHAVWSVNVVAENSSPPSLFGIAGSPLIWRDLVIVAPGGRRVWTAGDADAGYSSPQMATLGGVEQVLSFNADGLFAHAAADCRILWSIPWVTPPERNNVCQPIVWTDNGGQETVFISSGYGKGCALFDIDNREGQFTVRSRWQNTKLQAKFASAVNWNGCVYGLDNTILCCLDLHTGEQRWKGGRYGFGQLLLIDRHLLVLTDQGEVVLCDATPEAHREVARFPVLQGRTWNHPALSGDRLLIRNDRLAACVKLPVLPFAGAK